MKKFLKQNFGLIVVFFLWWGIILTNYSPGTFLSGWDNLHPEFNFPLNLKRAFFGSWQEYQGLGLLGGMGHGADLFRQLLLWVSSLVLPINFIRYFFHFSMLLTGALGLYFLLKDFVLEKYSENIKTWGAVGGALFYLFNLGTLQSFYLAWEAFSVHFGFLPWLFWSVFGYLKNPSRKNLLVFVLVNILAVSQGYVATVFLVYAVALGLVLVFHFLTQKSDFKKCLTLLVLTFCLNAFWLLPNLYFVFKNVSINTNAKMNLMATENNLLKNKKFGDFKDVLLLKGFWFDNMELQANGKTEPVMGAWVDYVQKPYVTKLGYLLFGLAILGLVSALKTKNKKALVFGSVFLLGFIFLANDAPIFSFLAKLLYKLPLFTQIFRFPFTKFSILTAFCLAIFYGVLVVRIPKLKIIFIILPVIFLFPVFQGKLFYQKEKARIPSEYFEVFEFFKTQDKNSRIANFPQVSYWGWTNYKWQDQLYSGSGFLWYGLEQPILDRAFDVWSSQNENYYWEISQALYAKNPLFFENVLEKYQVNWLILDQSVINPGSQQALFLDEFLELVNQSGKIHLIKIFGQVRIYSFDLQKKGIGFVSLTNTLSNINDYQWTDNDQAYKENGTYFSDPSLKPDIFYPFRSLFTGRGEKDLKIKITDLGDKFVFSSQLPQGLENYLISLPQNYEGKELVEINPQTLETQYFIPNLEINDQELLISFPKIKGLLSFESSQNKTDFYLPQLSHQYGYLIEVKANNISGKPLLFWLENMTNHKADFEVYLEKENQNYVIQPPMASDGLGYALHFDSTTIGDHLSLNEIQEVKVYLIPYQFLTQIKFIPLVEKTVESKTENIFTVSHPNSSFYQIKSEQSLKDQILVLSQAFDQGWVAIDKENKKILSRHFLVNNWENGWGIENSTQEIILFFWPQLLEYLGFGFYLILLLFSLRAKSTN